MKRILKVTRLQQVNPSFTYVAPLMILAVVTVIMWLIAIAIQRAGVDATSSEYITGMQNNTGLLSAFAGFLVYFGVQSVSTTFPMALVLGNTRRSFAFGTAISNLMMSAYLGAVLCIMLFIEKATNHWFIGAYIVDVSLLGSGNPLQLFGAAMVGAMLLLTLGGLFGALWVRFGAKGPVVLGLGIGLLLALTLIVVAPNFVAVISWISATKVVLIVITFTVAALLATWAAMRVTPVR